MTTRASGHHASRITHVTHRVPATTPGGASGMPAAGLGACSTRSRGSARGLYGESHAGRPPRPEPFAPQTAPRRSGPRARCARLVGRTRPSRPGGRSGPTSPTCASSSPTGPTTSTGRRRRRRSPGSPLRVRLDGLGIHFVHVRAAAPAGQSCLWSSATAGRLLLALRQGHPLLTDPARTRRPRDAFDVVVPDMPGFGYSDRPTARPPTRSPSPDCGPSSWASSAMRALAPQAGTSAAT